jgi:hypothetical protein
MDPLSDELTRVGGYLENDYGWNLSQEHFETPLFIKANSIDDYNQYYDVVVLGDSFSDNESHGWQNYLANKTGLSIISFNMFSVSVDEILSNFMYLKYPPKLFIYELVERDIPARHNKCDSEPQSKIERFIYPQIKYNPLDVLAKKKERNKGLGSIKDKNIGSAVNYVTKFAARNVLNLNITEVQELNLNRPGLFSSRINDVILVLERDFKVKDVDNEQIEIAKCSLLLLQDKIRLANKTEFVAMVFPNKTSVYSEVFLDDAYSGMSIVSKIEDTPGLNITHLYDDYLESVKRGVVDLYLPNDTHCGYYAYKQAADAVIRLLNNRD